MALYKKVIRVTDGAIIKLPFDCNAEIGNDSGATVTASVLLSIDDRTMATATEAQTLLVDASKFNTATAGTTFFTIDTIAAGVTRGLDRPLPAGTQLKLVGGNCTVTLWN